MPKQIVELSADKVSKAGVGSHAVGGVKGLMLVVKATGGKSWVLRTTISGVRRDVGLGGYPTVPLAVARRKAAKVLADIAQGIDPVEEKRRLRAEAMKQRREPTFEEMARAYIDAKSPEWTNYKHAQQWINSLSCYAFPVVGKLLVSEVNRSHVTAILKPIWNTKAETASRVRGRIEAVLSFAKAELWRTGENPAAWADNLEHSFSMVSKRKQVHFPALPWSRMPEFTQALKEATAPCARLLMFQILTAARSNMVLGARWSEFDLESKCWVVPAERMKDREEFRVALSTDAIALLQSIKDGKSEGLVFPAPRGGQYSDMTVSKWIKDDHARLVKAGKTGWPDPKQQGRIVVPHGFRSSFKDWSNDCGKNHHVTEAALSHVEGDKAVAAYSRSDFFDRRLQLMNEWALYCRSVSGGVVVPLQRQHNG